LSLFSSVILCPHIPNDSKPNQVTANLYSSVNGTLVNQATSRLHNTVTESLLTSNTGTDYTAISVVADVSVSKSDNVATVVPGNYLTYSIGLYNPGPSDAVWTTVTDNFSSMLQNIQWECIVYQNAVCNPTPSASIVSGSILEHPILFAGASVVYQVTAQVITAARGTLVNTASIQLGNLTDPNALNNYMTDQDTLTPEVDVRVKKTDGLLGSPIVSGEYVTYTIEVSNFGPSDAPLGTISVVDNFPPELVSISWTCLNAPNCTGSGTTNIADSSVILPYLGTVQYVVNAQVFPSVNSSITNWASIFVYNNTNSTDKSDDTTFVTTNIRTNADLSVTKDDNTLTTVPGTNVTYTIKVFNRGPSDANGVVVKDTFSSKFQSVVWSCVATARASCPAASGVGDINGIAFLGLSNNVTFTVTALVRSDALVSIINEASANSTNSDSDYTNNIATDIDIVTYKYDVSVSKSDNVTSAVPGETVTYSIKVDNLGPSDVPLGNLTVVDTFDPTIVSSVQWTCIPGAGAACTTVGNTDIQDSAVYIPASSNVLYVVTTSLYSSALIGNLVNNATLLTDTLYDSVTSNNVVIDTDLLVPYAALDVHKTDTPASFTSVPGTNITYDIIVRNQGPSDSGVFTVNDPLSGFHFSPYWVCSAYRAVCGSSGVSGVLLDTPEIYVNGSIRYTLSAQIYGSATGNLTNQVTITPNFTDIITTDNSAADTNYLNPAVDVYVNKTDGLTVATPGAAITYSVTVGNYGPSDALFDTVSVLDAFPSIFLNPVWYCLASANSNCTSSGSGATLIDKPVVRAGGSVMYVISGTIQGGATGNISNSASIAVWDSAGTRVVDTDPTNENSTDFDSLLPSIDLVAIKTDNVLTATPGFATTYTVNITNYGPRYTFFFLKQLFLMIAFNNQKKVMVYLDASQSPMI